MFNLIESDVDDVCSCLSMIKGVWFEDIFCLVWLIYRYKSQNNERNNTKTKLINTNKMNVNWFVGFFRSDSEYRQGNVDNLIHNQSVFENRY